MLLPWEFVQPLPQLAQLVFVPSGWQPLPAPLHSSKPAAQPVTVQLPFVHTSEALGKSHSRPQSPQSLSVLMLRSQPLFGSESQLLNPVPQTGTQPAVVLQLVVPLAFVHTSVHERQWAAFPSAVSQLPLVSQSALVASHVVG